MWRAEIKNRAFDRFGEEFHPVFDSSHFLGRSAFDVPYLQRTPPANIRQEDTLFELELAVPGFFKDEIEIALKDDVLTVCGEKTKSERMAGADFILEEFDFDSFERSFKLAPGIAREKITATCENGILKLSFRNVPEADERPYQKVKIE